MKDKRRPENRTPEEQRLLDELAIAEEWNESDNPNVILAQAQILRNDLLMPGRSPFDDNE